MESSRNTLLIASANGAIGMAAANDILKSGGSALDAVEAATRLVEANLDDHSVGVGGYPNALGEVELDASLMEGTTRRAGAVAALKNYPHPISIARAVLERLPQHVLLVGAGAARFAAECGFETANLLTEDAATAYRSQRDRTTPREESTNEEETDLLRLAASLTDPKRTHGTVNFLARDQEGRIASAVSTSGWAFKYPGRVGDSPIIGSGNYADDRYGACACTGLGEWSIRSGTARLVVLGLKLGMSLADACRLAMDDLADISVPPGIETVMNLIALDHQGNHTGFSTHPDRTYLWQTADMETHEEAPRTQLPV